MLPDILIHHPCANFAYYILAVISASLNVRFKKNRGGGRYKPDVISHIVTQDLKMREGPNRGMRCKREVCISLREYDGYGMARHHSRPSPQQVRAIYLRNH